MWRLWETGDELGQERNMLINNKWMPSTRNYSFVANSYNPYLFEIRDESNERATQIVRLDLEGGLNSATALVQKISNSTTADEPSVNTASRLIATFEIEEQKKIRETIISWVYRTVSIDLSD
mmetsp:Transcript_19844/g.30571  ORF Transcript_19844/g.30571 Transcript_19844/m.30571 type:complete len:122 (+) Transcript_19844:2312-2677(+)